MASKQHIATTIRLLAPTVLAVVLFVSAIFAFLIPSTEQAILDRKRDTIRELTAAAWNILDRYASAASDGSLSLHAAQAAAISDLRTFRYGEHNKDYVWITDHQPAMIMHPYIPELEGQNLSSIRDQDGVAPFAAFVEGVKSTNREAYVRYLWQWKDDESRVEPKLSYVRNFDPWDWIIGTGVYTADIEEEIREITYSLWSIASTITAVIAILLSINGYISIRTDDRRRQAEHQLAQSRERYRALVEASDEGVLLIINDQITTFNKTALTLLGFHDTDTQQLQNQPIHSLITAGSDVAKWYEHVSMNLHDGLTNDCDIHPQETELVGAAGHPVPVLFAAAALTFDTHTGIVITLRNLIRPQRIKRHYHNKTDRDNEVENNRLIADNHSESSYLMRPARELASKLPQHLMTDSIIDIARTIDSSSTSAVILTHDEAPVGIITATDIVRRVIATDASPDQPAHQFMTAPILTIEADRSMADAQSLLHQKRITYLPLTSSTSAISVYDVLSSHYASLPLIFARIDKAKTPQALNQCRVESEAATLGLVGAGMGSETVMRQNTRIADAILRRAVAIGHTELGPAPQPYAFLTAGSQARQEQTFATDQDNALIYAGPDSKEDRSWFLAFSRRVNQLYADAGYPLCSGEAMARNPKWCQSVTAWKKTITAWIDAPDSHDMMNISVFFDFRHVAGDESLEQELRKHLLGTAQGNEVFFMSLASVTMNFNSPLNLFGGLRMDQDAEFGRTFDIKTAIQPLANFARLYALAHGIPAVNTFQRLRDLKNIGILDNDSQRDLEYGYAYLMALRLRHQANEIDNGKAPHNNLNPTMLSSWDEIMLKKVLAHFAPIQARIHLDFGRKA